ncbi:hypothetical protein V1523DRAFT_421199 [Lipomyces doorenjongii]
MQEMICLWLNKETLIYSDAALVLAESFSTMTHRSQELWFTTWKFLGLWPMRVQPEFMSLPYQ